MNAGNRKPQGMLGLCPKCGMDSGERKCTIHLPERYFVRCASCGYIVGGWDSQNRATAQWNRESKARWNNEQE